MAPADRWLLAGKRATAPGILPDRLQHREARLAVRAVLLPQQALVDQRRDAVEDVQAEVAIRVADRLGRLERAASDEDREATEEALLLIVEQVVAPGDRVAERPLTLGQVAGAAGQQRQAGAPGGPASPGAGAA